MEDFGSHKMRNNHSRTSDEPYSRDRLEAIKRIVTRFQDNGKGKRYSIIVDGEMIVPKTDDPQFFDDYRDYIEPHTQLVEVRTFYGNSPNCNVYRFHLKGMPLQGTPQLGALGAVEVNEKIEQALSKQKMETTIMLLEKDKAQLEEQILSLRKKLKGFKKLQAKLDEKQIDITDLFSKGMELFGTFQAKKNGVPLPTQMQGLPTEPTAEVKLETEPTEAEKHFEELKSEYSDKQLLRAMQASEVFAKHPELRDEFLAIVNAKIKQDE